MTRPLERIEELGKRTAEAAGNVTVRFSSCSVFRPGAEADFWVVQAWSDQTGRWYYHPGPPRQIGFTDREDALKLAKKVALAGEINPESWWVDYPLSTFEAAERKGLLDKKIA